MWVVSDCRETHSACDDVTAKSAPYWWNVAGETPAWLGHPSDRSLQSESRHCLSHEPFCPPFAHVKNTKHNFHPTPLLFHPRRTGKIPSSKIIFLFLKPNPHFHKNNDFTLTPFSQINSVFRSVKPTVITVDPKYFTRRFPLSSPPRTSLPPPLPYHHYHHHHRHYHHHHHYHYHQHYP